MALIGERAIIGIICVMIVAEYHICDNNKFAYYLLRRAVNAYYLHRRAVNAYYLFRPAVNAYGRAYCFVNFFLICFTYFSMYSIRPVAHAWIA